MKRIKIIFAFLMATTALCFLSSCGDDTVIPAPNVAFLTASPYVSGDKTVIAGDTVKIGITAQAGEGAKIKSAVISVSYDGAADVTLRTIDNIGATPYNLTDFKQKTRSVAGTETYKFVVTDDKAKSTTRTVKITVTTPSAINSYTAKILGSNNNNTLGSFLSTRDGMVRLTADAKTNAGIIDLLYYYGATNLATVAAPSDADARAVFSNSLTGWTTYNATKIVGTNTTAAQFDAITNELTLLPLIPGAVSTTTSTSITNLADSAAPKVVAFQTAAGKKGLFKIVSIAGTNTASGAITIDVKVQR